MGKLGQHLAELALAFSYPQLVFYLEASPDVSASRNSDIISHQLHEKIEALEKIRVQYEVELSTVVENGIKLIRINTDSKSLPSDRGTSRSSESTQVSNSPLVSEKPERTTSLAKKRS